ncbi:MAG: diguanylate cyclase [Planctomycetes bacterium]|nr:diguanylate cyclase [Planctomycetota bacterium]
MNLFKNLSIGKKLLITLLLVSILPLFIITYGFYSLGKVKLTEQTIHVLKVQAENVATSINHFIDYKFKHLRKIADIPQLSSVLILKTAREKEPHIIRQTASSLRAKLRFDPDFLSFCLLDTEGNVALGTCDKADADFRNRPSFCKASKGEKYVSPPSMDKGRPSIYFSMPIRHANNIVGILVAQCDAEELWKLVETESGRVGSGNAVILSNSDGVRIAHSTTRDLIFKSWIPLKAEVKEQILQENRYGSDILEIASTDRPEVMDAVTRVLPPQYFQHELVIGKGTYHSVIKLMNNGWRIIATIPEATFLEPVRTSIFYMSIIGGIVTCVVIVASIIIGRLSTNRIHTFASISKEIARGNLAKRVPFVNGDEIGQLGKTFNIMTASIERKIEQLKYLNDVAVEIHSHIEIEHLLQDLVNISRRIINAEMGILALLDENGKDIKYFKVSMSNPCQIKEQPKGRGLLGAVIKKGQTIRLDDATNDLRSIKLPENHPPIRTLLGVPLVTNSGTVSGGLFLANKANNERFTLEDEEILLTISYQASVAIENARLYGQVQQLAITDGLTGLLNHKEFHRRLDDTIEGSKRYHYAVSLLMIDIDNFKQFNDTYGHQVGDHVLKTVADIIQAQTRAVDVCARYGGEEFAVIIRDADASQPFILSERIRSIVYAYPIRHNGIQSQLSVSIGIACLPRDAYNAEDLIKRADEALYMAKETGRNKVCCYKPAQPD